MVDFKKIKARKRENLPIDPYEIFRKNASRMSESGVNDLWAGQVDALREWHANRSKKDISLVLNTGAGKTLIGALVSQSIVNETRGRVVYVCGSIQLVEQTREKFESYGLNVTTYFQGDFSNDLFHKNQAVCITTYQALFNGKSKFFTEDIDAIVFDDAHTAEGMIKNHFSLEITNKNHGTLYNKLCGLFKSYYESVGRLSTFNEVYSGENSKVELIPPFEIRKNASEINRVFGQSNVAGSTDTLFAWEHIKNHLDLCAFFFSAGAIQITPPFIPIHCLPYFRPGVRRIYLTATALGIDAFIRTFGSEPEFVIQPDTPAGQCERQILFPLKTKNVAEDRMAAKNIVENVKALVITPSRFSAREWGDVGVLPAQDAFLEILESFKQSQSSEKLVMAARYDGIDLPGDTCRVLVLDGLPAGTSHLDRFQWESLKLSGTLRSLIACRVVQSLGRISRGMSDYGVVVIVGREYVKWLNSPKNQAVLPEFIQKQLQLGDELSIGSDGAEDLRQALEACLARDTDWLETYDDFIDNCDVESVEIDEGLLKRIAKSEVKFSRYYWDRDYVNAGKVLAGVLSEAFDFSTGLGSWYAEWVGYCLELSGDMDNAAILYQRAYSATRSMPRQPCVASSTSAESFPAQVLDIAAEFSFVGGSEICKPKNLLNNLGALKDESTVNQTEESLRYLGQYLGLDSTRPDNEHDIGPDVLWIGNGVALCIEAKTDKEPESKYTKENVGQLANHIQWVKDTYSDVQTVIPIFIGPANGVTDSASPSDEMLVVEISEFIKLADLVDSLYADIVARALPISLNAEIQGLLSERCLVWPQLLNDIKSPKLKT